MSEPVRVVSLGWGIQSWAMVAMSALGVLPPVEGAIHADTGWERRETIEFAERWTPWLEARGVRVVTVEGDCSLQIVDGWGGIFIPVFTAYDQDVFVDGGDYHEWKDGEITWMPSGTRVKIHSRGDRSGMLRRQCADDWKIAPIRRWLQAHRGGRQVEQWLGITLDEARRMAPSRVKYIKNRYPLIDMFSRPLSRFDCIRWLRDNSLEVPIKSSCIICPYHDRPTWREIKRSGNSDWERALEVDRAIRHKRPGYVCYLSAQRKPLDECDFRNEQDCGQLMLWSEQDFVSD